MHSRASHFWPTHILCGFLDDSKSAFRAGHHRAACVCVVKYKNQFVCKQRDKYLIIFFANGNSMVNQFCLFWSFVASAARK